ncbi:MAG: hypothetical protein A2017_18850 [Lentisphaerae bacterium GWF2_44_16]|nr:MAG: hypothetical protein A2017_18850 [Lentisphaerae bacterium GWF2_44_16]
MFSLAENTTKKVTKKNVTTPLKADLLQAIDDGILPPGSLIPSENVLSNKYGISRSSVRLALRELVNEGWIFKRPGKGAFVKDLTMKDLKQDDDDIKTIGINFKEAATGEDWYASKLVRGIEETCAKNNCRLALVSPSVLKKARKGFVDGIIVSSAQEADFEMYESFSKNGVPVAFINRITELENIAYFSVNYRKESEKAADQLLNKGHCKIGIVTAGINEMPNHPRYLGFIDAVLKKGLNIKPEICDVPRLKSNEFYANAIYEYLHKSDISAIYLLNGSFALPLFVAMHRLGVKTPDDLEIMCFDDIGYISSVYEYDFNYVKMPLFEMGRDAIEYFFGKFKGDKKSHVVKKIYNAELASRMR